MNIQHVEKSNTGLMYLAVGITGFIMGLIVAFVLFGNNLPAFGQETIDYEQVKNAVFNGPYVEVMNATENAANITEGLMIKQYVNFVTAEILGKN